MGRGHGVKCMCVCVWNVGEGVRLTRVGFQGKGLIDTGTEIGLGGPRNEDGSAFKRGTIALMAASRIQSPSVWN